ncbi:MAG: MFS transporter, partial [Desulfobacterales bacterium]|nr:MFS transporter [Desulfobacterales bacterium]
MSQNQRANHIISVPASGGWLVTTAASWLGLVFGILYVWSVIKGGIPEHWGWSHADKALPYSVMAVTFSFVMVPAGMLQDRIGPRPVVILGGFLAGLGCMIAGYGGSQLSAYILGFGIITGAGVGFGYAALTPAAVKWFPPQKTGMITGIVVAGAGLAPVPLAPLTQWLLIRFSGPGPAGGIDMGVSTTMICLGTGIWVACLLLARFIKNPPDTLAPDSAGNTQTPDNFSPREMVGSTQFRLLFPMYFSGASAGLVFISTAADL